MLRYKVIYTLLFMLASAVAWCQTYRVCDVSASPASVKSADGREIVRNSILGEKEMLNFGKFSKISLMETKSKEIFFFSGEGRFSVMEVVGKNRTQLKSNLKAHLKSLLQGKSHSMKAGVVYKDFATEVSFLPDDPVSIADASGNIVQNGDIVPDGVYYFVVSNTSDTSCFVNVIKTDASGNSRACCLSDDAMAQMDLLVPAGGTVMLTAFPQLGRDIVSHNFRVAASDAPFDARRFLEQSLYMQLLSPSDNSTVTYPDITLRYLVKDAGKVKSIDVFLNGMETAGEIPQKEGINELKIKLPGYGKNVIDVRVSDIYGKSHSWKMDINYERLNKPRLHVLSVGVGNYKNEKIEKLHFAASDAAMVAKVLDTLGIINSHLYKEGGYRELLTEEQATRGRILKCLDDIKFGADPEDIIMIYMSGHGKHVEFTSQRYFLPYDVEDDKYIESTAISYADLKGKLKQMEDKECKVIVFMDACYAGEMYFAKAANEFIGDADPAVIGFYSSTRKQPSLEKIELNHGVFTYALLNGIKGGAGDSLGNVTISSLGDYITEQVRIESQGRQTPKVDNGGEDFILFKVSSGAIVVSAQDVRRNNSGSGEDLSGGKDPAIMLAESYYTGKAVPPTMEDELKAYVVAAGLGDAKSMYMAGVCCQTGKGCPVDYTQALEWYGKAAVKGVAAAQYNLGTMYYNGYGTDRSADLAEKWFKEADAKGYAAAAAALGILYYHKEEPDYTKAFGYFSRGAEAADALALFYLGECYEYGRGTVEDISAAFDAYKQSADKGYGPAKEKLLEFDY